MQQVGIWRVRNDGVDHLETRDVSLVRALEDWIEEDLGILEHVEMTDVPDLPHPKKSEEQADTDRDVWQ